MQGMDDMQGKALCKVGEACKVWQGYNSPPEYTEWLVSAPELCCLAFSTGFCIKFALVAGCLLLFFCEAVICWALTEGLSYHCWAVGYV